MKKTVHVPPYHPGEYIRYVFMDKHGMSVTDLAKALKIGRANMSKLVNGRAGVSADMALRLECACGIMANVWLDWQMEYDLHHARKKFKAEIKDVVGPGVPYQPIRGKMEIGIATAR